MNDEMAGQVREEMGRRVGEAGGRRAVADVGAAVSGEVAGQEGVRADAALGALEAALDVLVEVDVSALAGGESGGLLARADRCESRLRSVVLALTAAFDASEGFRASGHRSVAAWLQTVLGKAPRRANDQVRTAQQLAGELEETRAALEDGQIDGERAAAVAAGVDKAAGRDRGQGPGEEAEHARRRREAESQLLSTARGGDAGQVRKRARRLEQANDEAEVRREARRAWEQRTFSVRRRGQTAWLEGRLHQLGGETLITALDALAAPAGREDERSYGQRMADALVELAERGLTGDEHSVAGDGTAGGGLPTRGGLDPRVTVLVPLAAIESRAGCEPATLDWSGPAAPQALEQGICDARLDWLITDADGLPLRYGHGRRFASDAQRVAMLARDGGCRWPGCDAKAQWCVAHHVDFDGEDPGPTDIERLAWVCGVHHNYIHHGNWSFELDEQATVTVRSPAGSIVETETAAQARDRHLHAAGSTPGQRSATIGSDDRDVPMPTATSTACVVPLVVTGRVETPQHHRAHEDLRLVAGVDRAITRSRLDGPTGRAMAGVGSGPGGALARERRACHRTATNPTDRLDRCRAAPDDHAELRSGGPSRGPPVNHAGRADGSPDPATAHTSDDDQVRSVTDRRAPGCGEPGPAWGGAPDRRSRGAFDRSCRRHHHRCPGLRTIVRCGRARW